MLNVVLEIHWKEPRMLLKTIYKGIVFKDVKENKRKAKPNILRRKNIFFFRSNEFKIMQWNRRFLTKDLGMRRRLKRIKNKLMRWKVFFFFFLEKIANTFYL